MCLYLRYKEECVATSNICVWKALINYGRLGYYSPIFNYRYNIGETYTSYLDRIRIVYLQIQDYILLDII